ncbi:MAG: PilZ domain-containing protein [Hyphomicrobiaceae bacterium]
MSRDKLRPADEILAPATPPQRSRLASQDSRPEDRRSATRLETSYAAACRIGTVSSAVEVHNASRTGAQIRVRHGFVPVVGQLVVLSFMSRDPVRARVVWNANGDTGVEFEEPLSDSFEAVHFEDLGRDYFRAILKFQRANES